MNPGIYLESALFEKGWGFMAIPNVAKFCQERIIEPVVQRYKQGRYVPLASELRAFKLAGTGSGIFGLGVFLKVHDKIIVRDSIFPHRFPLRNLAWRQILRLEKFLEKNRCTKSYTQIWCPQETINFGKSVVAHAAPRALALPLVVLALNEVRKWMMNEIDE
jgi:hypothetical protein